MSSNQSTGTERRHTGRYTIGKPGDDGRSPVFVDGAADPSGYVRNSGSGATPWITYGSQTLPAHYPDCAGRRWQAAEKIVDHVDAREASGARVREEKVAAARRTQGAAVPRSWRVASWDEIVSEGYRRVRMVADAPYADPAHEGKPDGGPRVAAEWESAPVHLTSVSRHSRASREDREWFGDFLMIRAQELAATVSLGGNHLIAVGALVPVDTPRRTVGSECPQCGADGTLYAAGTFTGCGACTAKRIGWPLDHLPNPEHSTERVFSPGERVIVSVPGSDGVTDTCAGTVTDWNARLSPDSDSQRTYAVSHRVRMPFGSWDAHCTPAMLSPAGPVVKAVSGAEPETVGGWRIGNAAVRYIYNDQGASFERAGWVCGFSDDPATGTRMVRMTTGPGVAATPYRPEELFRPGSHEAWQAANRQRLNTPR